MLRGILLALVIAAAGPAFAGEEALNAAQKKAVGEVIREYLLANPEIVYEALRTLRERQEAENRERSRKSLAAKRDDLLDDPAAPVGGNPRGDVTIVEFFDYQCGYCKRVFPTIKELIEKDGNIRYVFKEFPILGPASMVAARAALAVWSVDRGKYGAFHTALMTSTGALTERKILRAAESQGLDMDKFRAAMGGAEIAAAIRDNIELARVLGIKGTPAFVIGDQLVPGAADMDTFKRLVAKARKG